MPPSPLLRSIPTRERFNSSSRAVPRRWRQPLRSARTRGPWVVTRSTSANLARTTLWSESTPVDGVTRETARKALHAGGSVAIALVMLKAGVSRDGAARALKLTRGNVREAITGAKRGLHYSVFSLYPLFLRSTGQLATIESKAG